jgi:hypothetical protein
LWRASQLDAVRRQTQQFARLPRVTDREIAEFAARRIRELGLQDYVEASAKSPSLGSVSTPW